MYLLLAAAVPVLVPVHAWLPPLLDNSFLPILLPCVLWCFLDVGRGTVLRFPQLMMMVLFFPGSNLCFVKIPFFSGFSIRFLEKLGLLGSSWSLLRFPTAALHFPQPFLYTFVALICSVFFTLHNMPFLLTFTVNFTSLLHLTVTTN